MIRTINRHFARVAGFAAALALSACGGGGAPTTATGATAPTSSATA